MNSTTCYLPPTCLLPDQTRQTGPFPSNLARTNVLFDTILEPSPDLPAARNCYVEPLLCSRASIGPETTRGTKPLLLLWLLSLPLLPPLLPLLLDALSGRSAPTRAWTALDLVATPRQFLAGPTWLETRLGIPHPVYYPHQQERSPQPASSSPDRSRDLHECASVKSATTWTAPHLSLHHPPTYLPHLPTYLPTYLTHPPTALLELAAASPLRPRISRPPAFTSCAYWSTAPVDLLVSPNRLPEPTAPLLRLLLLLLLLLLLPPPVSRLDTDAALVSFCKPLPLQLPRS